MKRITKRITSLTLVFAVTAASVCGGVHIKGVMPQSSVAKAATEFDEMDVPHEAVRIDEYTNRRFFFFQDPDGLPIELYEGCAQEETNQ